MRARVSIGVDDSGVVVAMSLPKRDSTIEASPTWMGTSEPLASLFRFFGSAGCGTATLPFEEIYGTS